MRITNMKIISPATASSEYFICFDCNCLISVQFIFFSLVQSLLFQTSTLYYPVNDWSLHYVSKLDQIIDLHCQSIVSVLKGDLISIQTLWCVMEINLWVWGVQGERELTSCTHLPASIKCTDLICFKLPSTANFPF